MHITLLKYMFSKTKKKTQTLQNNGKLQFKVS